MESTTILQSAAYLRMRAENPSEFVPRSVFFAHEKGSEVDRRNSLWVKAALVYESVTGRHVNDKAKPLATALLLRLADACCSRIHNPHAAAAAAESAKKSVANAVKQMLDVLPAASSNVAGGEENRQEITEQVEETTAELPPDDEGSDEKKRVIDAIFLVVGFLPRLLGTKAAPGKSAVVSRDAIDEGFKSTHMQDIVTDVIKLENQLPLGYLLDVVDCVEDAIHAAAGEFAGLEECLCTYKLDFNRRTFHEVVVSSFCWYYSPFFNKLQVAAVPPPPPQDGRLIKDAVADDPKMASRTLLDMLHDSVVPRAPKEGKTGDGGGKTSRMPTARELSRSGVRIAACDDGRAVVEFEEQTSRLRLPALVHDFKLATVARNLRAREYVQEAQSKPVTRYFQMMNELVDEAADARILARAGVVRGAAAAAHEVIKRIDGYATYPSVFMAMDVEIEKVRRFHDQRMQNFFVRYRPGVIWASSTVAAVTAVAIVTARRNRA